MTRSISAHYPSAAPLVTGHFIEGPAFSTSRENGTSDWLLVYTLAGAGHFGHDGGDLVAEKGDVVVTRPGTRHDYGTARSANGWVLAWAHFHPRADWLELLRWPEVAPGLMTLHIEDASLARVVERRLEEMHRFALSALKRRDMYAMNALERALLEIEAVNPLAESAAIDERVRDARTFIIDHIADRVRIGDVADHVHLSVSRLAHLFKQQVGVSPQQFQEQERLTRARQQLRVTDRSIVTISADLGFDSPFYFPRRFRQAFGQSHGRSSIRVHFPVTGDKWATHYRGSSRGG